MQRYGFTRLTGVDPYAPADIEEPGMRIRRAELSDIEGKFDVIMMNHVLEHLADPLLALSLARNRLATGGRILVRVPLAGSFAHRKYGAHGYNLDAPRHLVVPSHRGLEQLAKRLHARVDYKGFDSQGISLFASNNYQQGITGKKFPPIGPALLRTLQRQARALDAKKEGDFGVFVLVPLAE